MLTIRTAVPRLFAGLFVLSALTPGSLARAQVTNPPGGQLQGMMAAFGAVGIVPGQTARLTAILGQPTDDGMPSCDVDLAILDGAGNRLAGGPTTIRSGATAHVDYAAVNVGRSRLGPAAAGRILLRAVAKAGVGPSPFGPDPTPIGPDPTPFTPCSAPMLATLEVFDSQTQQTTVVMNPAVLVGFNPQPDPPMPEIQ